MFLTRRSLFSVTIVLALCFVPVLANADAVTFQLATTTGCFSTGCSNYSTNPKMYGSDSMGTLSFVGLPTSSKQASTTETLEILLGTFTLDNGPGPGNPAGSGEIGNFNSSFTAQITFILPATITSGNPGLFTATLAGTVRKNKPSSVTIDFDNATPLIFHFTNADYTGSFQFRVNDLEIETSNGHARESANWTGQITYADQEPVMSPVPEPASMFLLGTGLLGGIGILRRRARR